ncbi:PAS domain-containing sensor histidine kinase [Corallococcus praedator]|uniref:histidine kinase n=1 Tax=Corallococcus praedator TaxID=2316724 RepID=A0ABX9QG93_9BACT|nr:PAS domain-containing sensor histidine kinase [Corallococcus sp. CA031C]RKI02912.1 PAS domain-containing sensor histidine kinase [Corallococcus praedator]
MHTLQVRPLQRWEAESRGFASPLARKGPWPQEARVESPSASFDGAASEGLTEAQSRLLLETLVACTPVGLAVLDLEQRFVKVNDALAEMNGIPRAAHLGRKVQELLPELWATLRPQYQHILDGGEAKTFEMSGVTPKAAGVERHFLTSYYPMRTASHVLLGIGIIVVEVTEQRRAHEALQASEQRYRSLVEAMAQPVWTTNKRGEVVEPAPRWMAFTGQTHAEHLGLGWLSAIHPEDRKRVVRGWVESLRTRASYRGEFRLKFHAGGYRDVVGRAVPVFDGKGDIREWVSTAEDVTERKQAEALLETERARLHAVLMNAPASIAILSGREQTFTLVNPFYRRLSHGEDLTGISLRSLPPTGDDYSEFLARAFDTGEAQAQKEKPIVADFNGTGDTTRRFDIVYQPLRDVNGQVDSVLSFAIDVTDRVEAREKLEEWAASLRNQQQWLEAVLDRTPVALILMEPHTGRAIFANQAARRMAGGDFPEGLRVERYAGTYLFTDETGRELRSDEVPGVRAARGEPVHGASVVWHTPTGRYSLLVEAAPLSAQHGHPAAVLLAHQDVSELRKTQAQLQHAVSLRDEFLTVASHELKTPLTPLQLKLQSLVRDAQTADTLEALRGRVMRTAESVSGQIRKMTTLINDLLEVTQLTGPAAPLSLEPVDLASVVQEVVERFSAQATRTDSELVIQAASGVVGQWDRHRLEQVVSSLLSNALKYGPGRPVTLTVERLRGMARLSVKDEGIGISPGSLQAIFEKFTRAVSTRHYGGLGLGLFITRQIIEAHQGTLRAESQPGQGATFIVELPVEGPNTRTR